MRQIGRLAIRVEGENWNAYYALNETMEDAIPLGSIRMSIITKYPERRDQFMKLMTDIVADILEQVLGHRPDFGGPIQAPEHERSGSA